MKRIMILGAGRGQVDLIKAAKKYGYYTIAAGIPGNYPGFEVCDEKCFADISKPEEVCRAAKQLRVDAVVTACLDTGIPALGYTCEQLGLCGLSENAARLSGDKLLMKSAFMEHGVNTARYRQIDSVEALETAAEELTFPLIIKAVDLQGSRGINIVKNKETLRAAYESTMAETHKDFCIIEEFIEGYEFGAQAFVVNGRVLYVLPCGDITYLSKTNIPVGHYAPLALKPELLQSVKEEAVKAIKAIGLDNCAVNIDMILKDDKVYLIELTGRVGANCLPQLSSIYYGMDVYRLIIETALGNDPTPYFEATRKPPTACYAKMLYSKSSGILTEIINRNPESEALVEVSFFVKPGDTVNAFTNSRDCIGEVVVKGDSVAACEKMIDEVTENIKFVLE